jgi:hypothetical protein
MRHSIDSYSMLNDSLRDIVDKLSSGTMKDNTRKARRMLMFYASLGIIWCTGVVVRKIAPGGVEVEGLIKWIPYILISLILYSGWQFFIYWYLDLNSIRYLRGELRSVTRELEELKNSIGNDKSEEELAKEIQNSLKDSTKIYRINWYQIFGDYVTPFLLLGAAIIIFILRYVFGLFVDPTPLVPHIPSWAPLWQ